MLLMSTIKKIISMFLLLHSSHETAFIVKPLIYYSVWRISESRFRLPALKSFVPISSARARVCRFVFFQVETSKKIIRLPSGDRPRKIWYQKCMTLFIFLFLQTTNLKNSFAFLMHLRQRHYDKVISAWRKSSLDFLDFSTLAEY